MQITSGHYENKHLLKTMCLIANDRRPKIFCTLLTVITTAIVRVNQNQPQKAGGINTKSLHGRPYQGGKG